MSEENLEDGFFIKHDYCVASELKTAGVMKFGETPYEDCGSSDGNALYEHDLQNGSVTYSGFCWSCKQAFKPEQLAKTSLAKELNITEEGSVTERLAFERKEKTPALTKAEVKGLIKDLGYTDKVYRGIKPEYMKFFGHLTKEDRNGNITSVYYPETRNGNAWPTGYKIRHLPKYFSKIGQTGLKSDMAGYIKFKGYENHRTVLICAGEVDMVSAYQMLREQQLRKGQEDYAPIAVLSPTTGEGSAIKQIRQHYEFLCSFENIVLGFDNDDVGNKSMEEIADILPKDKVKVIKWTYGDPNKALMNGKDKQFLSDFYNAKEFNDNGIFASHGLMPYIKEALLLPRVTLPSYMQRLQDMCKPSLIKNRIYNIIGITSCGKSTHVNNIVHHLAFLPNEKTAVVSLEATKGEYGIDLLSLHLETNLYWKESDNVIEYLESPDVIEKANDLFVNEDGESRFYVVDDRKGTVDSLEKLCETLRNKYGVTVIVIDVLTDLLRVTSNEEQAKHMNWQSNFVKSGVTIINVLHTRKLDPNKDGTPKKCTEYDAYGSSIFVQKAAGNIVINRSKECPHDDWIERNSTYVDVPKMRQGETGEAGVWLYDPETRQVYDREKFFIDNPEKLPFGYDLTVSSFDKAYWEEGGRGWKGGETSGYKSKTNVPEDTFNINVEENGGGIF